MSKKHLDVSIGQGSSAGSKAINQDFHGAIIPSEPQLNSKGVAIAIADGISSSDVSQIASEMAVSSFLHDYYCTSEAWSVKRSAQRVLKASNAWLHAQTRNSEFRFNKDKGYICAFSAMVIKSNTAHIFHSGDTRVYQLNGIQLEQITRDHRRQVSAETSYLTRALGVNDYLEMDYHSVSLEPDDIFVLSTDGLHEYVPEKEMIAEITRLVYDLDAAAASLIDMALAAGSPDNLTVQIVKINQLPTTRADEIQQQLGDLSIPTALSPRMFLEQYEILRELYISSRSHVFLAVDTDTEEKVVLKTPSTESSENNDYLESMLMEEWIGKRLDNAHVLKYVDSERKRRYLYTVTEFIEGKTLKQWMLDNPNPSLESVRTIIEQLAKGLQAFHRQEMVHQDLRPDNVMIDETGIVKLIDFGSTKVAGISEIKPRNHGIVGTAQFTAPEYFLGQPGTARSDLFSLGVLTYQMLSGKLPYGVQVAKSTTVRAQRRLQYEPLSAGNPDIPAWVDAALSKATAIDPAKRYAEVSEFIHDLRHPNPAYLKQQTPPLLERNPILFWKAVSMLLLMMIILQNMG